MGINNTEFDAKNEFDRTVDRMINALGQTDFRMPADYIRLALEEALKRWCIYTEGAFGIKTEEVHK